MNDSFGDRLFPSVDDGSDDVMTIIGAVSYQFECECIYYVMMLQKLCN